jgi:hypothetical protein
MCMHLKALWIWTTLANSVEAQLSSKASLVDVRGSSKSFTIIAKRKAYQKVSFNTSCSGPTINLSTEESELETRLKLKHCPSAASAS